MVPGGNGKPTLVDAERDTGGGEDADGVVSDKIRDASIDEERSARRQERMTELERGIDASLERATDGGGSQWMERQGGQDRAVGTVGWLEDWCLMRPLFPPE